MKRLTISPTLWVLITAILFMVVSQAIAEDWPTYLHDNHRSAATAETLPLPLYQSWAYSTAQSYRTAWGETPALQDFWQNTHNHTTRVKNKMALPFAVSGDYLYFGSSNTGSVSCLNTTNGSQVWKFFSDGPVRFTPSVYAGKVYFGSDDGFVYCLNAVDGSVVWKYRATSSNDLIFINGRLSCVCPVRTAVVVDNNVAYWGAGLFSGAETGLARYLCARNAETGSAVWTVSPPKPTQGYPLISDNYLYMPAGKSTPTMFTRSNGGYVGDFDGYSSRQGGSYALLTNDNKFFFGPHYSTTASWLGDYNALTRSYEGLAWVYANHLVVTDSYSYYSNDTTLCKLDRSSQQIIWSVANPYPYALILAGDTLFAGGDGEVAAIDPADGSVVWSRSVIGRANILAAANGGLFVSTDQGRICCFRELIFGDLDEDGNVDLADFAGFAAQWLLNSCDGCSADFTGDNSVLLDDLLTLTGNWMSGTAAE